MRLIGTGLVGRQLVRSQSTVQERDGAHLGVGPDDAGIAAEPGRLAPGKRAGAPHRLIDGSGQGNAVFDVRQELPIAQGLSSRPRDTTRPFGQGPHLLEQASLRSSG